MEFDGRPSSERRIHSGASDGGGAERAGGCEAPPSY